MNNLVESMIFRIGNNKWLIKRTINKHGKKIKLRNITDDYVKAVIMCLPHDAKLGKIINTYKEIKYKKKENNGAQNGNN